MINSNSTAIANQNSQSFLTTANLLKTVAYYQRKIEKSHRQLLLIKREHEHDAIGKEAAAHLKKQNKLVEIAEELMNRMTQQIAHGEITTELETQYKQEVDILNYMHFEVTKTYFSFINQNFEARIITLRKPMAA